MSERISRRTLGYHGLASTALWCAAVWLTYSVSHRLALAAVLGSVAFNLSEWIRDERRRRPPWEQGS